jgi:hypothetical protein
MKIILCHTILKKEISPLLDYFSKGDIRKYVGKAAKGLGVIVSGSRISDTQLIKVYMTGKQGAGRMIVLLYVKKEYYVPVVVRLKKDKIVGSNLSKGNRAFYDLIEKNLDLVMHDLQKGAFDEL